MADSFDKKPKPEQGLGSEQKPKLSQNSNGLNGAKVQPGSPDKMDHVPVGINKRKFESDKHADKRLNKMFKETNQPTLGVWNHDKKNNPIAKPDKVKFNPGLEYKPTKEQINQAKLNRQKIINQGFAPQFKLNHIETTNKPEAWSVGNYDSYLNDDGTVAVHFDGEHVGNFKNKDEAENFVKNDTDRQNKWLNHPNNGEIAQTSDKKQAFWDRYNSLSDDQKKDFALNVYHHGTDAFDNPVGKFRDPYTGEIMYADAENNYEDRSDYLLANDEDSRAQLEEAVNNLDIDNMSDEEIEKLFGEHETEDLEPWDEENSEDLGNDPGTPEEQRRILKGMGYNDEEIEKIISEIPSNHMKF